MISFAKILSDEMIFQIFPPRAFPDLEVFADELRVTRALEKECPIFADIKSIELIPSSLPSLVKLLTLRSKEVLRVLKHNASVKVPLSGDLLGLAQRREASHPNMEDWRITGSLHPVLPKRSRPVFNRIKDDAGSKRLNNQFVGDRGSGSCTKHYNLFVFRTDICLEETVTDSEFKQLRKEEWSHRRTSWLLVSAWCLHWCSYHADIRRTRRLFRWTLLFSRKRSEGVFLFVSEPSKLFAELGVCRVSSTTTAALWDRTVWYERQSFLRILG